MSKLNVEIMVKQLRGLTAEIKSWGETKGITAYGYRRLSDDLSLVIDALEAAVIKHNGVEGASKKNVWDQI